MDLVEKLYHQYFENGCDLDKCQVFHDFGGQKFLDSQPEEHPLYKAIDLLEINRLRNVVFPVKEILTLEDLKAQL